MNRILQYVSTVGGCLVLVIWLHRWYRRTERRSDASSDIPAWARCVTYVAAVGLAVMGAVVELGRVDGRSGAESVVRPLLTGLVSGGLLAVGLYVVLWHISWFRRSVPASP